MDTSFLKVKEKSSKCLCFPGDQKAASCHLAACDVSRSDSNLPFPARKTTSRPQSDRAPDGEKGRNLRKMGTPSEKRPKRAVAARQQSPLSLRKLMKKRLGRQFSHFPAACCTERRVCCYFFRIPAWSACLLFCSDFPKTSLDTRCSI